MFNRKKLDKERMEIYLVHLFLSSRRVFFFAGILVMFFAFIMSAFNPLVGLIIFLPAFLSLMMVYSFKIVLMAARFGSWVGTIFR